MMYEGMTPGQTAAHLATDLSPTGDKVLIRMIGRPLRQGSLYTPAIARETTKEEPLARAPGSHGVGQVMSVGPDAPDDVKALRGAYVAVQPEGGRGAHGPGCRYVFFYPEEILARLEIPETVR